MDSKNESIGRFINQFNCFQTTRLSSLVAVEILLGAIRETRILFARLNRKFHGINAFVSAPSAISKRRAALEKRCNNILVMRRDTKQRFIRVAYLTTRSLVGTRFHLDRGQNRCNEFIVTTQTRYRFFFTRVLLARFQIFPRSTVYHNYQLLETVLYDHIIFQNSEEIIVKLENLEKP